MSYNIKHNIRQHQLEYSTENINIDIKLHYKKTGTNEVVPRKAC
jgi:hypothetical protein